MRQRCLSKSLVFLTRVLANFRRQHERQFRGFNGLQLAFEALQKKLAVADSARDKGESLNAEESPSETAERSGPSKSDFDADALKRAAEILSPELHELSQ